MSVLQPKRRSHFLFPKSAADLLFLLAIGIVMFFRFTRVSREQAHAAAELEAARSIQPLLIPANPPTTPGFTVESVYLPANEVGGDFFQVLPANNGSLLIETSAAKDSKPP